MLNSKYFEARTYTKEFFKAHHSNTLTVHNQGEVNDPHIETDQAAVFD
jgi:hypothetical protein